MLFYSLISSLILSVFLLFISGSESVKTLKHLTVRRGGSLTVPCLYEEEYKSHRKYWCKGEHLILCRTVAKTNTRNTGISVADYPSQNMFTVDLKNLQDSDSGWYRCALEIVGPDVGDSVYLTVSSDPAVWVENSTVIGQEGGGVSVQGFYSSGYKNEVRKWCRVKTWSCWSVGRTNTSQSSAVMITDYSQGSFRVEMFGLQKSDAGWYWFSAGGVGVTVHLTVTERPTKETTTCGSGKPMESVEFCIAQN
ncbi:CMRF35-like molecule 3 [Astyanax mexicanus]|uniref:CMRF35-like molecule 3 n=1 Tax=Astyanax mexicanus TaxID=7994 RepID=A0A8T2M344_ASTMX|nr:CMRF35-like molecule 3 [Astyanax mexicanus]